MNICDLINQHAVAQPDRAALIHNDREISFLELSQGIAKWSRMLGKLGMFNGDRLGIAVKDTPDFLFGVLGGAHAGIITVPIDWRAKPAEKEMIAHHFKVAAVLVDDATQGLGDVRTINVHQAWADVSRHSCDLSPIDAGDSTLILKLSSGTTGLPKGAVITHRGWLRSAAGYMLGFGNTRNLRHLSATPLCYSAGIYYCLFHLVLGNTVVFYPPLFGASEYVRAINSYDIGFAFTVPTVLRWLLELADNESHLLPNLKFLVAGGAPLTGVEKRQVAQTVCSNFFEVFASAGAGNISTLRPADLTTHSESLGRPNLLIDMELVDDDERPVPVGEPGRVRCRGPGVASGYYGSPDQTHFSDKLVDGWCYTGDLARLEPDGFLYYEGRVDDLILRGGANIQPARIESVLEEHDIVREAAVVGREHATLGQEVVAYVVLAPNTTTEMLQAHCRSRLPPHLMPVEIIALDVLPKTTSGKVLRRELRSRA